MTRTRAADDFATIRARLDELRRERAQAAAGDSSQASHTRRGGDAEGERERRYRDRREGKPPPWVPTIFTRARIR